VGERLLLIQAFAFHQGALGPLDQAPGVQRGLELVGQGTAELAEQSGVAKSIISQIERNETNPTLATIWRLAIPYFRSEDRWAGRGLLVAVIGLNLGIVFINVLLNQWNNAFYNSLQDKNYAVFVSQLFKFTYLAGAYIVVAVYQLYLNQMLQIRWRRWLTDRYLEAWLEKKAYYRMQLQEAETDNPDQRIAEDLRLFVGTTLGLTLGIMRAVVTLVSFVAILWTLSGPFTIPGVNVTVPGYMVWAALLYAIVGTWLTDWIGRPLVTLNFNQQRYEAHFRFSLVGETILNLKARLWFVHKGIEKLFEGHTFFLHFIPDGMDALRSAADFKF